MKVLTIVGTRPEIIRLSQLINKLDRTVQHYLVHTGQNQHPKLNEVFFSDLGVRKPDLYLDVDVSSMGSVMGQTLMKIEPVLKAEAPDAVVILGDTNSAIAGLVAERLGIPVYHLEAGNRSFDSNVPEEINRRMIDHVASFNLPYNSYSMNNLLREGIHPRTMMMSGSPLLELDRKFENEIETSKVLEKLGVSKGSYLVASIHRQENVDNLERLSGILSQLDGVAKALRMPFIVSTHPRTRNRLEHLAFKSSQLLRLEDPFGYFDYNKLQRDAYCVVSDSGTIYEEASIQNFAAVCLRDSTERVEGVGHSRVILCPATSSDLRQYIQWAVEAESKNYLPAGYEIEDFSDRVMRFILSTAQLHKTWSNLRPLDEF